MNSDEKIKLMGEGKISTTLIKIGLPTMIGMMISALYNIVDTFWVGRLGTVEIAAVSVVFPISTVGMAVGLLFGSGANSVIARMLGQKDYDEVKSYSSLAVYSGLGIISLIIITILLFLEPILRLLGTNDVCMDSAKEYAIVFTIGLVFNVFNMTMNNMSVAEGNSMLSMIAMIVGGAVNMILDPILIFSCGMGVAGAALATMISRIISSVIYIRYALSPQSRLSLSLKDFSLDRKHLIEIAKIGLPVAIFQILSGVVTTLLNRVAKIYGEEVQAAIGIVNKILFLEINLLYGFFKGYSPIVGYNFGAGKMDRVNKATKLALIWSTTACVIIGIVVCIFARPIILMFNKESAVVLSVGIETLRLYAISYCMFGFQIIIGNYFLAIGEAKRGGILSIARQGFVYIPLLYIMNGIWGLNGMISAQLISDVISSIINVVIFFIYIRGQECELVSIRNNYI